MVVFLIDDCEIGPGLARVRASLDDYVHVSVVGAAPGLLPTTLREGQQRPTVGEQESRDAETVVAAFTSRKDPCLGDVSSWGRVLLVMGAAGMRHDS